MKQILFSFGNSVKNWVIQNWKLSLAILVLWIVVSAGMWWKQIADVQIDEKKIRIFKDDREKIADSVIVLQDQITTLEDSLAKLKIERNEKINRYNSIPDDSLQLEVDRVFNNR